MALENYLKPDLLDGDNQYFCSICDKKCDAKKGLKL
jgi:ubiquitin carboxyl-terminal hydrolase 47